MQDAALARRHGREDISSRGGADLDDGGAGEAVQLTVPLCLESAGVEGDAVVLFGFEAQHFGGEVFDGEEELSVAGGEEMSVRPGEFDDDLGTERGFRARRATVR